MSSTSNRGAGESEERAPLAVSVTISREQLVLAAIVVGQAAWLGFVMIPGWYSAADLPNLAFANGRSLDWGYLTSTLGGHFGVAQRLIYWSLNRVAPLEWWLTVLIRVAFQALTTVLLWRLFRNLVGSRPWLWIVLLGYAFSDYLVPGIAALNSGLGLVIGQACLVGAMLAQVRYTRERRLVDAAVVAGLVLVMLAFAQQTLPMIAFLPVLAFVFSQQGPWRERARGGFSLWPGWLLLAVALSAFVGLYLVGDYNSPSSEFTLHDGLWLSGQAWLTVLGPALVGGPWQYYSIPYQWSAYADVPVVLLVLGQVGLIGLIVLSVRRTGWLALVAWFIPVWTAVAGLVLVGFGRGWLGVVLPSILRYSYYVPLALSLGIVLAFGAKPSASLPGTGEAFTRLRADAWVVRKRFGSGAWAAGARAVGTRFGARRRRALVVGTVALLLASSAFSTMRFAHRFWQNPAEDYTATVLRSAEEHGPGVQLYDTLLPEAIVPYISEMYVSDLLGLGGVSADFGGQSNNSLVVNDFGRIVPARFLKIADFMGPRQQTCGIYVHGLGTTQIPLETVSRTKEWFLQLELYQPHSNRVTMTVLDENGDELAVTSGSPTLDMKGTLVVLHRRLATGVPTVINLKSTDPETNFCLVHTYVGVPVP